ncbi:hypothetical protein [Micromonospora sp. SH-82]|uniref:hypothetical protein n=1 Tax=Micromonospora sp. SH-82 TaxID=3132938 RepID=UPI003EB84889
MGADGVRLDAVRAAYAWVTEWLLDMQALVGRELRHPLTGATAETAREAEEELHRLGCLSLALDPFDDDPGPDDARLAGLLTDPIEVTFTSATGEPVHVQRLALDEAVEAARRHRAAICQLVDAYRTAVRFVEADLDRLRRASADPGQPGAVPADRLAALTREAAADPVGCARPGLWREGLAALERDLIPRSGPDPGLAAATGRLRSSVQRLRHLAAEAVAEGLAGPDPSSGPGGADAAPDDVDDLLARAAAAPAGGGPDTDLVDDLHRAADEVDAVRRRLRGRCHRELRGRLEAYRQRAADEGLAEHPDLEDSYRQARAGLSPDGFTVTAASRAVRAYQQAVNEVTR